MILGVSIIIYSLLITRTAFAATPIFVRPGGNDTACNGEVDLDHSVAIEPHCAVQTINQGINIVDIGGTVNLGPGIFTENITVDKWVTLSGAGSGNNPINNTILRKFDNSSVVTISASGNSASEPIILQDFRIEPVNVYGVWIPGSISDLTLSNIQVIGSDPRDNSESEVGLWVATSASVNRFNVTNSAFDHLTYGWYLQKHGDWGPAGSNVTNLNVTNTSFSHNGAKGAYVEKLSDANFDGIMVDNNGIDTEFWNATWNAGFDINLKGEETYQNFIFENSDFTNNGLNVAQGAALMLKARDDGSTYGAHPATLNNITVSNCNFSSNERAIRIGEPNRANATPTDVIVKGNNFDSDITVFELNVNGNNLITYANNITNFNDAGLSSVTGTFNARRNWWGSHATRPTGIDLDSWDFRLGAAVSTWADGSNNVNLNGANLSGGLGTAVIISHGSGLVNAPFSNGVEPYVSNLCSDFYDFFVVNGSGTWQVQVPVNASATCSDVRTNNGLAYIPVGSYDTDCNTATNAACWDPAPNVSYSSTHLISSNLSVTDLGGTPFVAGAPDGPFDPTAINLKMFGANNSTPLQVLVTLIGTIMIGTSYIVYRKIRL